MTLNEQCSFRSGWLTRHIGGPRKAKAWEVLEAFTAGFDARRRRSDVLQIDAMDAMVSDERQHFSEEAKSEAA